MEEILEAFKIYLLETGRITSEMTIQSYLGNIEQLLKWLDTNNKAIDKLDRVLMLKYLEHLKDQDYKPNTFNTKINSITNFNNYLKDKDIIERDIIFGKDKIQLSGHREVDVYTAEEIELIEAYLDKDEVSQRDRLIIQMLKELGLRTSELINLKLDDIDLVGLEIEVHGKGNKRRNLPIKSSLAVNIRSYIAGERKANKHSKSTFLFISERAEKLHRNTVLDLVKQMGNELGIEKAYSHKFRHTLATKMSSNGKVPIQVIQEFLGHSEIQTTIEYYVNIDKDQLKKALESI